MFAKIGDLATSIVIGHARSCMVMPSSLRALLAAAAVAASPDGSNSNCANHSAGCWLHLAGKNCSAERDCGAQLVCLRGQCRQCTADSECSDSERRHDPASCLGCTRQRSCASALAAAAAAAAAATAAITTKPSLHTSSVSAAPVPEQVCRRSDAYSICAHKDMWPMDGRDGAGLAVAFVTTALTAGGSVGGNPSPSPNPSLSPSPSPNPNPDANPIPNS